MRMKKGKKWIALTRTLAIGVMTLTGGSDAKVVQADASDEEVVEATQELLSDFEEYAGNDYEHFAELYRDTSEETIKNEFDAATETVNHIGNYDRQIFQVLAEVDGYYAVGNTFYIVAGTHPNTHMEWDSYIWVVSEKDGEWKFDYSDEANEKLSDKIVDLYPAGYAKATNEGKNTAFFGTANYMYVDETKVYEGCNNNELKYMYQNDDGSVVLGIWLANGTNNNIYYSSGTLTVTDETLGTVIDLSDLNVDTSVKAMNSRVVELTIPASEVMTGTQGWGSLDSNFGVDYKQKDTSIRNKKYFLQ